MFKNITEIKNANREIGHYFFEKATMKFFNSRILRDVYKGKYFITSEKGPNNIRAFTVRIALESGEIDTVGEFQAYASAHDAKQAIKGLE